jgi:hypothetical protein
MNMLFFLTRLPVVLENCGRELLSWAVSEIEWGLHLLRNRAIRHRSTFRGPWLPLRAAIFLCREKGKGADKEAEKPLQSSPAGRAGEGVLLLFF